VRVESSWRNPKIWDVSYLNSLQSVSRRLSSVFQSERPSSEIECLQDTVDGEVRAHRLAPGGNNTDFLGLNRIPG
jgi:hypothetical protein